MAQLKMMSSFITKMKVAMESRPQKMILVNQLLKTTTVSQAAHLRRESR